jgi:hypothetical protein
MSADGFRASRPTLSEMQRHVERLCEKHGIIWHAWAKRSTKAQAITLADCERYDVPPEIITAPIRSAISYAVALHEIGHCLGRYQRSSRAIIRETWAWDWAQRNALAWTPAMERHATSSLAWYRAR